MAKVTRQELADKIGEYYLEQIAKALNVTLKDELPGAMATQILAVKNKMGELGTNKVDVAIAAMAEGSSKTSKQQPEPPEVEEDSNCFQLALMSEFEAAGKLGSAVGQRKVEIFQQNSAYQFAAGLSQVSERQSEAMLKAGMAVVDQVTRELPLTNIDVTPIKGEKNDFFSLTPSQTENQRLLQGS